MGGGLYKIKGRGGKSTWGGGVGVNHRWKKNLKKKGPTEIIREEGGSNSSQARVRGR